jgi:hypothetical protein
MAASGWKVKGEWLAAREYKTSLHNIMPYRGEECKGICAKQFDSIGVRM